MVRGSRLGRWEGDMYYVRNVIFSKYFLQPVKNLIIIYQNYCDLRGNCSELKTGVHISNVVYKYISGTCSSKIAINLNCSLIRCLHQNIHEIDPPGFCNTREVSVLELYQCPRPGEPGCTGLLPHQMTGRLVTHTVLPLLDTTKLYLYV